ncbi:MAG TPA: adenylate/guanylate cyclase domain-containing protein, partial [Acidimicrobiales bacterium]|nr:adenylate/guanylate cyclase domain-containing protein [Acidimicrobiales bacterium]
MGVLPVGTVTLLLADIEGSTRLWEERANDMPVALADLDAIVGDVVEQHNGVRPVEQGEGDSFVVAFARATDAVACAVALQRATHTGMLRLRMGLNTGEVQLRDEGNYMGPAINRAARVRDLGHGGQVLLAQSTVDLVDEELPESVSLADLGSHRLRDVGRPIHLWQLAHPDLRASFPPLRGLDVGRNNLPLQLTSFVGRDAAVAELHALLDDARAVTVTGAGGCGKTRLALHVASERVNRYSGGVWFVDFAPVNEPSAVATLVTNAVGAAPSAGTDPVEAIVTALEGAPTLLVLDNCEHLVPQCAALVEALLRSCGSVTVLATSREPLGIVGESTFRVPSLSAPSDDATTEDAATLREYEAVELFLQRAA